MDRTKNRISKKKSSSAGRPALVGNLNVEGICENNWGQPEQPKKPAIWYYLEARRNIPDQQLPFPRRLFGRN